jgi:hypothetical protein
VVTYLWTYWSGAREDHFACRTAESVAAATEARYERLRPECEVFPEWTQGLVALRLFYSESRKDNVTTATPEGAADAVAAGYRDVQRVEGFIYPPTKHQPARSQPLVLYWHEGRGDNFLVRAQSSSEGAAVEAGYRRVRLEGYAPTTRID